MRVAQCAGVGHQAEASPKGVFDGQRTSPGMVAPPAHLCRKRYFTNGSFGVRSSHCSTDCSGLTGATKLQHVARQPFFRSPKKAPRSVPLLFRKQRSVVAARALERKNVV